MSETEKKGITVKINADLHAQIRQYIEANGMTMTEFVSKALDDELHPKTTIKEEKYMGNMRTMAFQVPEDLFLQIKDYWTCTNHDKNADNCSAKLTPEDIIKQAFISMCNKLIQHYREILLPLRRSLQELNMRRFSGNTKIIDIHKNIADIKEQRHVLSRLRKKGFMDEKKYNDKLTELESQLARQERELKKTAKADNEDDTLEQLDILIDSIEKQDNITTEFDEELFGIIVERIIVRDKSLEFILISGLSLKENI